MINRVCRQISKYATMSINTKNRKKLFDRIRSAKWGSFLIDLIIVFVGVYGAFQMDSYRSDKEDIKNRITYFETFESMLDQYLYRSKELNTSINSILTEVKSNPDKKIDFVHDFDFTNSIYIVESVFSSDRFAGVDSRFMRNLESGGNVIKAIEYRVNSLRDAVRDAIISGSAESKEFRQWYIGELTVISGQLSGLITSIEEGALPQTRHLIEELEKG